MRRITVPLADDHTIVREGFCKRIELEDDLQIVGEAQDGRQAVAMAGKLWPAGVKTVEKHREHLMEKLDNHDTAGLTRYAIGAGITESSVQLTIVQR